VLASLSRFWDGKPPPSQATQAATTEAFLPVPDGKLEGEVTLGSLTFPREHYHAVRALLVEIDAADETHGILEALKALVDAPLKTTLLLRRGGRESTYAKKEMPALGFLNPYVAVHWNPSDENASERLRVALRNVAKWMRGDRSALYPCPPVAVPAKPPILSGSIPSNPLASMFKEQPTLNFSEEVFKHARKGPMVP
jgi:hypothetical protein